MFKKLLGSVAGLILLGIAGTANAGLIAVVSDVNANAAINFPMYDNILGGSLNVLFSRDDAQQNAIRTHYNSLAGVSATESAAVLTAGSLAGTDLLVVTRIFNNGLNYSAAEIAAVGTYLGTGGSLMMITESSNASQLAGYNNFLTGVGSAIQYTGLRFGIAQTVSPVEVTALTGGVTQFQVLAYNTLSGGTAAVIAANGTVLAFEGLVGVPPAPVPEPATLTLFGLGLLGLGFARRRKKLAA